MRISRIRRRGPETRRTLPPLPPAVEYADLLVPRGGFAIGFFRDPSGDEPVRRWLWHEIGAAQRRVLAAAMHEMLRLWGRHVAGSEFGSDLGQGLYEFRARGTRGEDVSVYFSTFGRLLLVFAGHDRTGGDDAAREETQVRIARERLRRARRHPERYSS